MSTKKVDEYIELARSALDPEGGSDNELLGMAYAIIACAEALKTGKPYGLRELVDQAQGPGVAHQAFPQPQGPKPPSGPAEAQIHAHFNQVRNELFQRPSMGFTVAELAFIQHPSVIDRDALNKIIAIRDRVIR